MDDHKNRAEKEARKGITFMLIGLALLLKIVLAFFGIELDNATIDEGVTAILGLFATFGVYRNNYFGRIGRAQYKLFKDPEVQEALEKALTELHYNDVEDPDDLIE